MYCIDLVYFSLVRFNITVNTIRSIWCKGCVQTEVLSENHKTKSAALSRLITQTKESSKKRNITVRMTNIQNQKEENVCVTSLILLKYKK